MPPKKRQQPQMADGSWIVAEDELDEDRTTDSSESDHQTPTDLRSTTRSHAVNEPEFIFPSIHEHALDASPGSGSRPVLRNPSRPDKRRIMPKSSASRSDDWGEAGGRSSVRKRTQKTTSTDSHKPIPKAEETSNSTFDVMDNVKGFSLGVLGWIYDVSGGALSAIKRPVSYAIAVYLFFGMLLLAKHAIERSIWTALSPICRIPGSSYLPLSFCQVTTVKDGSLPATHSVDTEFSELVSLSTRFEDLLTDPVGYNLPWEMKRSEASIRDLRTIVRFSNLQSKNELTLEFDAFIETARTASYDLSKFNSRAGHAIDHLLASAKWTRRRLDDAIAYTDSRGSIGRFISDKVLGPFQPITAMSRTEATILEQYVSYSQTIEEQIFALTFDAKALQEVLRTLEEQLDHIHGISVRDSNDVQGSRDEVLSQLWTMLGGSRKDLKRFERELTLLRKVGSYRKEAMEHVTGTLLKLQEMKIELEELRERVGSAEVVGEKMPLSLHLDTVQASIERLQEARNDDRRYQKAMIDRGMGKVDEERLIDASRRPT